VWQVIIGNKCVRQFTHPNAFGENALITNQRRVASIIATTRCKCLVLDRMTFQRLNKRREIPSFWHRSSLKTKWGGSHEGKLGEIGTVVLVDSAANEVQLEFQVSATSRLPTVKNALGGVNS
jgi:CRP-like cAMP-binding protein